MLKVIFILCS